MSGMSVLGDITPSSPAEMSEGGMGEGTPEGGTRSRKSPNAFRTISEVAEDLHIPQHVLRFWETKFPQLKPLKRGGGRRYYRPEDINLLRRIGDLLYTQGYTIKGVQRLLREGGLEGVEAAGEGDDLPELPPEGSELRACLEELEAIAASLKALAERH
ncbi:MerR family transcriptional regulator [Roseomonas chloroacetimidivorans]|jgi:DNA-binding transcriptional MerR regulator|uniref:MerR family transcriptional regulator n=1 Tax=Roseomonas chloroacetimidivorans TaxID=1766656 RepID=UPI003C772FCE